MRKELDGIECVNRHELEYLYDEIFLRNAYLRHGLSLTENAIVFDVGANIGMFSLFVRSRCPSASIYAFEPIPPVFRKLERNMGGASEQVHLFCCGVSNAPGEANFTFYPGFSMMSVETVYANTVTEKELVKRQILREQQNLGVLMGDALERRLAELLDYRFQETKYQCPLRCISDVIDEQAVGRIDFLKIDAQRAEFDVLNGIRHEHWPMVRQIAMEVHDRSDDSTSGRVSIINAFLCDRGFSVLAEQDARLAGTDRHNIFALRPSQ